MGSRPKVKRKLESESTSTSSRKTRGQITVAVNRVLPSADAPTSIWIPFRGFQIVIALRNVANAAAADIEQFKQLIPDLQRSFDYAARHSVPRFTLEKAEKRTDIFLFTFDNFPLCLSIPDFQTASEQDIVEFSHVVARIMSFFQQEAAKQQKRGRGRPRASSVVARPRASSADSVSSDASTESQARIAIHGLVKRAIYKETEAIKPVAPNIAGDTDSYPSYLLEDVSIEVPPGLSAAEADYARNVIHQLLGNRASGLKVTGLLVAEDSQKSQLVKYTDDKLPNLNRQYITLENVVTFSIGLAEGTQAPTLWVLSDTGHFEIRPSSEYRIVFANMCKVIGLTFFIEDWYDGSKASRTWNSVDDEILEILREFTAFKMGTTDTEHQWVLRCREYKLFFISQLNKANHSTVLQKTSIYQWFDQGCPDLHASVAIQPFGPEPDPPHFYPVADNSDEESDLSDLEDDEVEEDQEIRDENGKVVNPYDKDFATRTQGTVSASAGFKGPYISSIYPQGAPTNATIPVHIAALICHMVENERRKGNEEWSVKTIGKFVYYDFSIHEYAACQKLVCYFGKDITDLLPDEYGKYAFYKTLAQFPKELSVNDEGLNTLKNPDAAFSRFKSIIEGRNPFVRRGDKGIQFKAQKSYSKTHNMAAPRRPHANSRRKAPADLASASFGQRGAPGSYKSDVEMEDGQYTFGDHMNAYHARYSAPKWTPELEHTVTPNMEQRYLETLNPEERSKFWQERIMTMYNDVLAKEAQKTPEEIAQAERVARIKKKRVSHKKF